MATVTEPLPARRRGELESCVAEAEGPGLEIPTVNPKCRTVKSSPRGLRIKSTCVHS
jgi:hypothetical protein